MKKILKIFFCVSILIVIWFIFITSTPSISYDRSIIVNNEEEYTNVARICYEDYCKYDSNSIYTYYIDIKNKQIGCYTNDSKISLNDNDIKSCKRVHETYTLDKHCLDIIYVYDTFVTFAIANGRSSFIYSVNKIKPQYINRPDEDKQNIYTERITDYWYYACPRFY